MERMTNHQAAWSVVRMAVTLAVAITAGIGLAGCGDGPLDPLGGVASGPATPGNPDGGGASPADSGSNPGSNPGGGDGSGTGRSGNGDDGGGTSGNGTSGNGTSGNGEDGGAGAPANEPPYIRDLYQDAYVFGNNEGIEATIQGHAFDPDGPHEQENVARVEIDWGDGSTTDAGLGGHGAFDAIHEYGISYLGETMTVRVVAHGYDGQTATQTVFLALPLG